MFRISFVQKVLFCNTFPSNSFSFRYRKHFDLLHNFIIHFFLGYARMSYEVPTFRNVKFRSSPSSRNLETRKQVPMFQSSVVMRGPLRCVFLWLTDLGVYLQWYPTTLLQLNCNLLCCVLRYILRCVMRCFSRLVSFCTASLRRVSCRLFLCVLWHVCRCVLL